MSWFDADLACGILNTITVISSLTTRTTTARGCQQHICVVDDDIVTTTTTTSDDIEISKTKATKWIWWVSHICQFVNKISQSQNTQSQTKWMSLSDGYLTFATLFLNTCVAISSPPAVEWFSQQIPCKDYIIWAYGLQLLEGLWLLDYALYGDLIWRSPKNLQQTNSNIWAWFVKTNLCLLVFQSRQSADWRG